MPALSDYLEAALLDFLANGSALSPPDIYVALYTDDPTDADVGTEVSGGSYARVQVNANGGGAPQWSLAAADGIGYKVQNAEVITFPTATAPWGTITHIGLRDAASGGNLLYHGELDESKTIGTGDTFQALAGTFVLRIE